MIALKYDFASIEPKWQKKWQETGVYKTADHSDKPKFYGLVEFPYPSGQGLHVGHARPYTAMDVVARKRRMDGYNVLFPMGYDAFGLPTENYAIKNHIHPAKVTHDNIENFRKQLPDAGLLLRLGPGGQHHRPQLLQVDPVDLPPALQARPGLQDHHARELVHLLQVCAGQ